MPLTAFFFIWQGLEYDNWKIMWIVFPVMAIITTGIINILNLLDKNKQDKIKGEKYLRKRVWVLFFIYPLFVLKKEHHLDMRCSYLYDERKERKFYMKESRLFKIMYYLLEKGNQLLRVS